MTTAVINEPSKREKAVAQVNSTLDAFFKICNWWSGKLTFLASTAGLMGLMSAAIMYQSFGFAGVYIASVFLILTIGSLVPAMLSINAFSDVLDLDEKRQMLIQLINDARNQDSDITLEKETGEIKGRSARFKFLKSMSKTFNVVLSCSDLSGDLRDSVTSAVKICNPATLSVMVLTAGLFAAQCFVFAISAIVYLFV